MAALWGAVAERLAEHVHVVGWDLPGHGRSPAGRYRMPDLAAGVLALVDGIAHGAAFHYAGDSIGGAVGLQLMLDAPERLSTATLLCTGAAIGGPEDWVARAATVRTSGTGALVEMAAERWFAAGFIDREPAVVEELVGALRGTDDESYAQACEALADFDVTEPARRDRHASAGDRRCRGHSDTTGIVGAHRFRCQGRVAGRARRRRPPGACRGPGRIAELIIGHVGPRDAVYDAGMAVRRDVLGDAHVDRAIAGTTEFTAEFQDLITRYAWGTIWTRPGLDRRSRSMITLTALVARGHHEELAMHVRAARRNGLTNDEIKEVLLQTAIYCGVPDANTAFRIANQVLADYDARADEQ